MRSRLLNAAIISALCPLVLGVLIFLAWLILRKDWLVWAGVLNLYFGFIAVVISFVLVLIFTVREILKKRFTVKLFYKIGACLGLICLNFICAYLIIYLVDFIIPQYVIAIDNKSHSVLTDVRILTADIEQKFNDIAPQQDQRIAIKITREGSVTLLAKQNNSDINIPIQENARRRERATHVVTIEDANSFSVYNRNN